MSSTTEAPITPEVIRALHALPLSDLEREVKLYGYTQLAELLNLSRSSLKIFVAEGRLVPTHRTGRKGIKFSHAEVKRFLRTCEVPESSRVGA